MDTMNNIFARNLRILRTAARLTQVQLARKADVSKSLISMYENGHRAPTIATTESLADALDVLPISLLFETVPSPSLLEQYADDVHFIQEMVYDAGQHEPRYVPYFLELVAILTDCNDAGCEKVLEYTKLISTQSQYKRHAP